MSYLKFYVVLLLVFGLLTVPSCIQNTSAISKFKNANNEKVNGKIISQIENVTVLKVWGTHKERGYAYGYLLGDKIREVYEGYIGYVFKPYIAKAKEVIKSNQLTISSLPEFYFFILIFYYKFMFKFLCK
ncbi:MAG: hypothetical protein HC831_21515, partial [Chloroflexia bacterium]|nr:hypothetical protein [Chloroflexia bacterium]